MTSDCRRFREEFEPGLRDPHRAECPECSVFAETVESMTGARANLALPATLRDRLRSIPDAEERRRWSVEPLPMLPLPERLRARLESISRGGAEEGEPPSWIKKPRYAVAATYLLTIVLGTAVGNPLSFARQLTEGKVAILEQQAKTTLAEAGNAARERVSTLEQTAVSTYRDSRTRFASSVSTTQQKIRELADSILSDGDPKEAESDHDPTAEKGDNHDQQ